MNVYWARSAIVREGLLQIWHLRSQSVHEFVEVIKSLFEGQISIKIRFENNVENGVQLFENGSLQVKDELSQSSHELLEIFKN